MRRAEYPCGPQHSWASMIDEVSAVCALKVRLSLLRVREFTLRQDGEQLNASCSTPTVRLPQSRGLPARWEYDYGARVYAREQRNVIERLLEGLWKNNRNNKKCYGIMSFVLVDGGVWHYDLTKSRVLTKLKIACV